MRKGSIYFNYFGSRFFFLKRRLGIDEPVVSIKRIKVDGQKVDGPNGLKVNDAFERTSIFGPLSPHDFY